MRGFCKKWRWMGCVIALLAATTAWAQPSIQFPQPTTPPGLAPAGASPYGAPAFDPYSPSAAAAQNAWGAPQPFPAPITPAPAASPYVGQPYGFPPAPAYGAPYSPYGPAIPPAPAPAYPPPPPLVGQDWFQMPNYQEAIKFVQDVRFRHTWLNGDDDPLDLDINDSEVAATFAVPNFLFTRQPIFITPGFVLHLWDGPSEQPADLPPNAYSAYLDFQYVTDPQQQLGAELGVRVGAYTDFDTFNSKSIRVTGLGLGTLKLNPTMQLKLGVVYINRNDIKLLPAGGLLWQPTPQLRLDLFFPQPKAAFYLTNVNGAEVWSYVTAEYGGGAWTIERTDTTSDRVDINDIRIGSGIEWMGPRGWHGFLESGFAFDREVVYVEDPSDSFDPEQTFYFRAGIAY